MLFSFFGKEMLFEANPQHCRHSGNVVLHIFVWGSLVFGCTVAHSRPPRPPPAASSSSTQTRNLLTHNNLSTHNVSIHATYSLGNIDVHSVWQTWHPWNSTPGSCLTPWSTRLFAAWHLVTPTCVARAGAALGDIELYFE